MATSARDLLVLVQNNAYAVEPTIEDAEAAITALGHAGRVLGRVCGPEACAEGPHWSAVDQLAAACRVVSAGWSPRPGRLPDLVGAACDLIGRGIGDLGPEERWAVAVELATASRRCSELALRHRPYARVSGLRWVHGAAVAVEQDAARRPPRLACDGVLDRLVPGVGIEAAPAAEVVDALAALGYAVRSEAACGRLSVAAALATATAGGEAARVCAAIVGNDTRMGSEPWRKAPASWQVVQAALVRFADGSQRRGSEPSATVTCAMRLHRALAHFKMQPNCIEDVLVPGRIASQLPMLARELQRAALRWGRQQAVFARARDLIRREELVPAILRNRVVPIDGVDVAPVVTAIRVAERLSLALAAEANLTAPRHPQVASSRPGLDMDARWAADLAARVGHGAEFARIPGV